MHLLSELIDAGSQFVIKKEGKWLFIKSTVMQIEAIASEDGFGTVAEGSMAAFKACLEVETEGSLFALFIFGINSFYALTISLKGLYIRTRRSVGEAS